MIARFRVLLPYRLLLRAGDKFEAFEVERGSYRGLVHPPYQAAGPVEATDPLSDVPVSELAAGIAPAIPQVEHIGVTMDGAPTVFANAFQIDVRQEAFDRSPGQRDDDAAGDPPIAWFLEVVNAVLSRLRSGLQAPDIKAIRSDQSIWGLEYLEDDGSPIKRVKGEVWGASGFEAHVSLPGLNEEKWGWAISAAGMHVAPVWETLQLDAEAMLPEVGPAIVLAETALETVAERLLDVCASAQCLPAGLWQWINDEKKFQRPPSVAEQFDDLLRILGGRSLKDAPALWEKFQNLKRARNSFVHEGVAKVGSTVVSPRMAADLVAGAREILDWVDPMLATEDRRGPAGQPVQYQTTRMLVAGGKAPGH
jgi:hypothetical protein